MHMADALVSPAVGGTMWAASAGLIGYCSNKVQKDLSNRKIPLMGVLGAFIFAAQMINFAIPGTGSSGHLGGGMILAILLGRYGAFLTIASVLTVQALFFADGGLLALGCNIFNLGFFPCFVAYPLLYKKIVGDRMTRGRIALGATLASIVGLQLGAFSVVLETLFSGITELPFTTFVLLMQPIHLGIGLVEGFVTAAVVVFVWRARPEITEPVSPLKPRSSLAMGKVLVVLLIATVVTGGAVSWFASANPDGLEWSMFHTSGKEELETPHGGIYAFLSQIQEKMAFLPDYAFKRADAETVGTERWPAIDSGTTVSGLVGGVLTLIIAGLIGFFLRKRNRVV